MLGKLRTVAGLYTHSLQCVDTLINVIYICCECQHLNLTMCNVQCVMCNHIDECHVKSLAIENKTISNG